jgi:hypothetical protein
LGISPMKPLLFMFAKYLIKWIKFLAVKIILFLSRWRVKFMLWARIHRGNLGLVLLQKDRLFQLFCKSYHFLEWFMLERVFSQGLFHKIKSYSFGVGEFLVSSIPLIEWKVLASWILLILKYQMEDLLLFWRSKARYTLGEQMIWGNWDMEIWKKGPILKELTSLMEKLSLQFK